MDGRASESEQQGRLRPGRAVWLSSWYSDSTQALLKCGTATCWLGPQAACSVTVRLSLHLRNGDEANSSHLSVSPELPSRGPEAQ